MIDIVCPACHGRLLDVTEGGEQCGDCGARFPARAQVPALVSDEEWSEISARMKDAGGETEQYLSARRSFMMSMYYDWWVERMLAKLPGGARGPILELMSGGAEICRRLPPEAGEAVAVDLNARFLEKADRELRSAGNNGVKCVCGNAAKIPLPGNSVRAVMIQGGLHHARPLLSKILAEIRRVLQPGGYLVCSEPANDCRLIRRIRRWSYSRSGHQGKDAGEDGFTREELGGVLAAAGLTLQTYHLFGFVAYPLMGNADLLPLLSKSRSAGLGRILLATDGALSRIPIVRRMAWASIFRAIKEEMT